jgi:hypothetical protein
MRIRERTICYAAALLAAGSGGCWSVPNARRPAQEVAITSGKGATAHVELVGGADLWGELVAVGDGQIWILSSGSRLKTLSLPSVQRVTLGVFWSNPTGYAAWTSLGALSTLSHGGFLIFSLPIWLLTGIPSSIYESNRGVVEYPTQPTRVLRLYARFPQGIPAGVTAADVEGTSSPRPAAPPSIPDAPASPAPESPDAGSRL